MADAAHPGAAQPDVRGRQMAWLLVFAPGALAAAIILTAFSGQAWAWPWVCALLPALLGGAAGLWVWAAVVALAPGPDPRHGGDSLLDRPSGGMAYPLFWLAMLPAVPASAVVLAGTLLHSAVLRWSGVPVGLASGALLAWGISHLAAWRLEDRGPELLHLMRSGTPSGTPPSATPSSAARAAVFDTMPRGKRWLVVLLAMLGSIALFPQSLMPILLTLSDSQTRVWFLALYLPAAWRWPTIAGMLLLGLVAYGTALRLYLRHKEDGRRDCQHAGEQ